MNLVKICVIGIRGLPGVEGGIEAHAEQLYKRLVPLGCDVEVIVRSPFVPAGQGTFEAMRLRRLWSPQYSGVEALVHSVIGVLYAGVTRPDILHVHGVGPAIVTPLARLLGLRVIVTHHGPDYDREKWGFLARWILRVGERFGMRYSHARIVISRGISALVESKYVRNADLIPNGVIPGSLHSEVDRLKRYSLEPGRYFLQVSRLVPEKRQLDLIRAYALARPAGWKLALVGKLETDKYSKTVEEAAKQAGVVLTGYLNGEALAQLYSHAGAFVLPSSHEGLPIALLEALGYGLPVLASAIPANLEVGLEGSSYFPLGDVHALADALRRASQTPLGEQERLARRQWAVHTYDWNRIAQQTLAVYQRVRAA
jgi:glycosyltransferase involved in cell wall biosynthesis